MSQLVQHTHSLTHEYFFHILVNTKHSHKYECTNLLAVSHSGLTHVQSLIHKYYVVNHLQGHVHYFFSLTKTKQSSGTKSLGIELQPNEKPRTHRKLPHQPTKHREYVRMIIMTDNKKGTNQKPKSLNGKKS